MINLNEILDKSLEIEKKYKSINSKQKKSFIISLVNLGFTFSPLSIYTIPVSIGLFAYGRYLKSQNKKLNEKIVETTIDMENYMSQMEFMNKLAKSIDEYYKESFKDYNFIK